MVFQAEAGDYEPDQPRPLDNVGQLTFAPNQNKEMEEKILELHKSHRSEIQVVESRPGQGCMFFVCYFKAVHRFHIVVNGP